MYNKMILAVQGSQKTQAAQDLVISQKKLLAEQEILYAKQQQRITELQAKANQEGLDAAEQNELITLQSQLSTTEQTIAQTRMNIALGEAQVTQLQSQSDLLSKIKGSVTSYIPLVGILVTAYKNLVG